MIHYHLQRLEFSSYVGGLALLHQVVGLSTQLHDLGVVKTLVL